MSKKKILLLSDDLRLPSGVGTMSKHMVLGSVDRFDWVQLGAAIKHPDQGKVFDLSEDARNLTGVSDASVKVMAWNGYGDPNVLRQLLNMENPDAILHFTDPRQWLWLYQMEHEVRQNIPIFFYHIWDDLPDPLYNRDYYECCDWIGCISKQTYGLTKRVWGSTKESHWHQPSENQIDYVPHGIDTDIFQPIDENHKDFELMNDFHEKLFEGKNPEFVLFYNSRNIHRKRITNAIYAFKRFLDGLDEEKRDGCRFILHTTPVDNNGTDLPKFIKHLAPEYIDNFIFSTEKVSSEQLNALYNIGDATIHVSSNEGFGLGTAESLAAGTPIIVTVTGGLQDQCGFRWKDGDYFTAEDYVDIGSLHDWRSWEGQVDYGDWATPIWPRVSSLQGSPPTPYIFDDLADIHDITEAIKLNYERTREERKERGLKGREWLMNEGGLSKENMCDLFKECMTREIDNFQPRKRFEVYSV